MWDNMDEPIGHYAKWSEPVPEEQTLHEKSKIVKLIETESRMVVARGKKEGEMGSCSSMGIKCQLCKWINSRDMMYNIVTTVNIELCT